MPDLDDLRAAQRRLDGIATRTPIFRSRYLSELTGAEVLLKAENLQRTGSFKIRGATNRIATLDAEHRARGVVAASAGNHAQGVALAAAENGVKARVYMPIDASMTKVQATRSYGAETVLGGLTFDDAQAAARDDASRTGALFLSAFDDDVVIAGQGTLGLELVEQVPAAEVVVVPCGGGGLLSGVAIALKALSPQTRIVGVQAEGCNPFVRSRAVGRIETATAAATIADGIAVKRPGDLTFPLIQRLVDDMVAVGDEVIVRAMSLLLERQKLMVEGAGAAGVAALLSGVLGDLAGKRVVVVLSGGNIDLPLVGAVIRRDLTVSGRYLTIRTRILDRPGELMKLLQVLAAERVNIVEIDHHRTGSDIIVTDTGVAIVVETRDRAHAEEVLAAITRRGYPLERTI